MQLSIRPTPGLRQSCELRHAVRQKLLSFNHHRVELFFNGFPNCAPDEGDACNDLRLLLLENHARLFRQHQKAVVLEQELTVPIFQHIQPAETRDAQDALVVRLAE